MTDYDKCTDNEIADLLEELNRELVKKGLLHAGDDCVMMVAFRRLREYGNMSNLKRDPTCLCGHPQSEHGFTGVCLHTRHASNCNCVDFKPFRKVES